MKAKSFRLAISAAAIACALPWIAQAEYRCDPPPTPIDRGACKAAEESPKALGRYIQRVRWIASLLFDHYVNEKRILAWEAALYGEREAERKAEEAAIAVAPQRETR